MSLQSIRSDIPQAPGKLPWLGHALPLSRDTCSFLVEQYRSLGPVFRFSIPGRSYIALAGLEANRWLMKHEDTYFSSKQTYPLITKELGTEHYLNAMDGKEHHAYRHEVRPLFREGLLTDDVLEQIDVLVSQAADRWCQAGEISVLTEMQRLFLDVFGLLAGQSPAGQWDHVFQAFTNTFITASAGIKPKWFLKLPGYVQAKRKMRDYLRSLIEGANGEGPSKPFPESVLSRMQRVRMPDGSPLREQEQLGLAMVPYLNSTLYVGRAATSMLYYWLERPEIMEAIRQDGSGAYAVGSLYESLRLVPMAVAHPRYVKQAFDFEGYPVAQGEYVMFAVSVTHYLSEHFPNPERFEPERYVDAGMAAYRPPAYAAFGLGPHACLGARLVEDLMRAVVPKLLRQVKWAKSPRHPDMVWTADPVPGPSSRWTVQAARLT